MTFCRLQGDAVGAERHAGNEFRADGFAAFFASYKAEIVHLASIAQAGGVEIFCIGNDMSSLSGAQYRSYCTDLISAVREVYYGELTYAALLTKLQRSASVISSMSSASTPIRR